MSVRESHAKCGLYQLNSQKQKIFFTSDTHFGHNNIIRFCNRPFASAEDMNEAMIENWNSVVGPEDIVFHLGDFGFGSADDMIEIRKRLNGKIYLIIGNHDWALLKDDRFAKLFELTSQQLRIRIDDNTIYLNHCPFLCFPGSYNTDPHWQLFGHVHSGGSINGLDLPRLINLFPTQYDVGVDNNNFTPVSYEAVYNIISERKSDPNKSPYFLA